MRAQRISVLMDKNITQIKGLHRIEEIHFVAKQKNEKQNPLGYVKPDEEFFIKPDVVIAENGLGAPKVDLKALMLENADAENSLNKIGFCTKTGYPATNVRFSLLYNDN